MSIPRIGDDYVYVGAHNGVLEPGTVWRVSTVHDYDCTLTRMGSPSVTYGCGHGALLKAFVHHKLRQAVADIDARFPGRGWDDLRVSVDDGALVFTPHSDGMSPSALPRAVLRRAEVEKLRDLLTKWLEGGE